jgi:mannose-1-phosphate guanylyltransferase
MNNKKNQNITPDAVLILSAGKGERLKPITNFIPKPLIDIEGVPVFAFSLFLAYKAGFREFIVNTHHLAEILEEKLKELGKKKKLKFKLIREKELLGTGGTIKYVFEKFKYEKILVMNSDIICDADIKSFINSWSVFDSIAHIMIKEGELGGVDIDENTGKVKRIYGEGKGGKFTFTGIHLVKNEIKNYLESEIPLCIVRNGYSKILDESKKNISFFIHDGLFFDIGTPERLNRVREAISIMMEKEKEKYSLSPTEKRFYNFFVEVKSFLYGNEKE